MSNPLDAMTRAVSENEIIGTHAEPRSEAVDGLEVFSGTERHRTLSMAGARKLCDAVIDFWTEKGFPDVQAWPEKDRTLAAIEAQHGEIAGRSEIWVVRSNLRNGVPPAKTNPNILKSRTEYRPLAPREKLDLAVALRKTTAAQIHTIQANG